MIKLETAKWMVKNYLTLKNLSDFQSRLDFMEGMSPFKKDTLYLEDFTKYFHDFHSIDISEKELEETLTIRNLLELIQSKCKQDDGYVLTYILSSYQMQAGLLNRIEEGRKNAMLVIAQALLESISKLQNWVMTDFEDEAKKDSDHVQAFLYWKLDEYLSRVRELQRFALEMSDPDDTTEETSSADEDSEIESSENIETEESESENVE